MIRALAQDPQGRIIVAGGFSQWNSHPCFNVVRLLENGEFDSSFDTAALFESAGAVTALALLPDSSMVIANCEGRIVELNSEGQLRQAVSARRFTGDIPNTPRPVSLLMALDAGRVLVGGRFPGIEGGSRPGLVEIMTSLVFYSFRSTSDQLHFRFPSVEGTTYRLEQTDSILDTLWTRGTEIPGTGDWVDAQAPRDEAVKQRYYRLQTD